MRLALHWRTLGPEIDLETLLTAASMAGFPGLEAPRDALLAFAMRRGASRVARLFAQHGVCQVATWFGPGLLSSPPEFAAACAAGGRLASALRGLTGFGVAQSVLTVEAPPGAAADGDAALERLRRVADLAASAGFQLLLEEGEGAAAQPGAAGDLARLSGWVLAAARPNVGLVVDCSRFPGGAALTGTLPAAPLLARLGAPPRRPPGEGRGIQADLPAAESLHALHAAGYGGYVSVDAPAVPAADPFEAAKRLRLAAERTLEMSLRL